jgi:hypothetical protein
MEELVKVEDLNAVELFKSGGTDELLAAIGKKVDGLVFDATTAKGRADIKACAYKVTRTGTAIEKMGKSLSDELELQKKPIMGERNKAKAFCKDLAAKVRKPLTDYEDQEKDRIAVLENKVNDLVFVDAVIQVMELEQIKKALAELEKNPLEDFAEFREKALILKQEGMEKYKKRIAELKETLAKEVELERLRKAEADRIQKEREDQIRKEAAAKAETEKEEAIEKARLEKEGAILAFERQKQQAIDDAKAAGLKAEADKKEAVQAESRRLADIALKEANAKVAREADQDHMKKINTSVLTAMMKLSGVDKETAIKLITAIIKGAIPHTKINY